MQGVFLKIYLMESRRVHGQLPHDWLLAKAKGLGVRGGTVFRAIAGFGRHGAIHEENFFELAGELPVEVDFACQEEQARQLLSLLEQQKVSCFHAMMAAELGSVGPE